MGITTINANTNDYVAPATDVRIDQPFTAATVWRAARFDYHLGTDVVDVKVGVIPFGGDTVRTLTLTVPMRRLLNGRKPHCIRTIRFNHLLNIITSWASETQGVSLSNNSVVFLGFSR